MTITAIREVTTDPQLLGIQARRDHGRPHGTTGIVLAAAGLRGLPVTSFARPFR